MIMAQNKSLGIICTNGSILKCNHWNRLTIILKKHHTRTCIGRGAMQDALDDFLHILSTHNNDNDLHYMSTNINCNISVCPMFKRNYRDRDRHQSNEKLYESSDIPKAYCQVMDKIHSYFHVYDIGYKLDESTKKNLSTAPK